MFVDIYRAKGKNGYIYDITFNPIIDFNILKSTRNVKSMEIIAQRIEFQYAYSVIKSIYKMPAFLARLTANSRDISNIVFKRSKLKIKCSPIKYEKVDISNSDLSKIEEIIIGRIISLERLIEISKNLGYERGDTINIIQALYCERRIKMMPSRINRKNERICNISKKKACKDCSMGFKRDDILLYAADNYNVKITRNINIKKMELERMYNDAKVGVNNFIKLKNSNCSIICAPGAFEVEVLSEPLGSIIKNGGRILFITSNISMRKVEEGFKNSIEGVKVKIIGDEFVNFRDFDICISSYENYKCFHKAFDVVVLDYMKAFIKEPPKNFICTAKRGTKEGGKFIFISCSGDELKNEKIDGSKIMIPVSQHKNPIIEPRIVVSKVLNDETPFIPEMAAEIIEWSISRNIRVFIFVPDEEKLHKVYFYITEIMKCKSDLVQISTEKEKDGIAYFRKGICSILISSDLKDALLNFDNVNVIVMYSDCKFYTLSRLINLSAIAVEKNFNKFDTRQVLYVGSQESEEMSLAQKKIRYLNEVGWEKGYLKK